MRVLDLFCGAGGAAWGYHLAWPDAEIVGVDIKRQPRYPFTFIQGDAMTFPLDGFDFIHASPPCHDHSNVSAPTQSTGNVQGTGWMLAGTVERLRPLDVPWVVENVGSAKMPAAPYEFKLCGSSFLLDLWRHRKFVSNVLIPAPPCAHYWQTRRFPPLELRRRKAGTLAKIVGVHGQLTYPGERQVREQAMRIDWMTNHELTQAIPPAYTEWIGQHVCVSV